MSSMWNVSVLNKGNNWIDLYVEFAHPDAGPFPEDNCFAVQLLASEAYGFDKNYNYIPKSPLGEQIPTDKFYVVDYLDGVADNFISKTVVYHTENLPWDEDAAHEKMNSLCMEQGLKEGDDEWDDAWQNHWIDFWNDPSNLPWAKYRIWVTDPKWIEHLSLGQKYDTASYSQNGPWINENRQLNLEEENDGSARKGIPGFKDSEIPPRDSNMNPQLIRSMAQSSGPISDEDLAELLSKHKEFLNSGGGGGSWERLHISGLPINLYYGSSSGGEQMKLSMKMIAPESKQTSGNDFSYSDMAGGLFENVNFSNCIMNGALMTDAFFQGANFEGAQLVGVDFTGSDMRGVNFRGANLRNADFEIVNCEGADFTGADLTGATFKGANLSGISR